MASSYKFAFRPNLWNCLATNFTFLVGIHCKYRHYLMQSIFLLFKRDFCNLIPKMWQMMDTIHHSPKSSWSMTPQVLFSSLFAPQRLRSSGQCLSITSCDILHTFVPVGLPVCPSLMDSTQLSAYQRFHQESLEEQKRVSDLGMWKAESGFVEKRAMYSPSDTWWIYSSQV